MKKLKDGTNSALKGYLYRKTKDTGIVPQEIKNFIDFGEFPNNDRFIKSFNDLKTDRSVENRISQRMISVLDMKNPEKVGRQRPFVVDSVEYAHSDKSGKDFAFVKIRQDLRTSILEGISSGGEYMNTEYNGMKQQQILLSDFAVFKIAEANGISAEDFEVIKKTSFDNSKGSRGANVASLMSNDNNQFPVFRADTYIDKNKNVAINYKSVKPGNFVYDKVVDDKLRRVKSGLYQSKTIFYKDYNKPIENHIESTNTQVFNNETLLNISQPKTKVEVDALSM